MVVLLLVVVSTSGGLAVFIGVGLLSLLSCWGGWSFSIGGSYRVIRCRTWSKYWDTSSEGKNMFARNESKSLSSRVRDSWKISCISTLLCNMLIPYALPSQSLLPLTARNPWIPPSNARILSWHWVKYGRFGSQCDDMRMGVLGFMSILAAITKYHILWLTKLLSLVPARTDV